MSKSMIWLSYPLDPNGPRPPAIPAPSLVDFLDVEKDGASVQTLSLASHTGTHLDTSAHIMNGGTFITDFSPESLIFRRPVVIDLSLKDEETLQPSHLLPFQSILAKADIALFRFGYGKVRSHEPARFCKSCPGFGVDAARWVLENLPELKVLGLDVPSFSCIADLENTMRAHNVLLERPDCRFLILEEMKLDADLSRLAEVHVHPWRVEGMHSGPCSIVGILGETP